jgi:soluble lytic murein transglycosylase-like protein
VSSSPFVVAIFNAVLSSDVSDTLNVAPYTVINVVNNKNEVGLYFAAQGFEDISNAKIYGWSHLDPARYDKLPTPYFSIITKAAKRFNLPVSMLYGVMMTESRFDPYDISPANAIGLFQMIPSTGTEVAKYLKIDKFIPSQLLLPENSILFGAAYLHMLFEKFGDNPILVIAAYNAGPHQVTRWLKRKSFERNTDEWIEEIPFSETRKYVKLVLGRWILYARESGEKPPVLPKTIQSAHSLGFKY